MQKRIFAVEKEDKVRSGFEWTLIEYPKYNCKAPEMLNDDICSKLYIDNHPHWKITEIYMDKGTSSINRASYEGFSRMMEDARSGKIDYIVSKSVFRFARNLKETLNCVQELRQLDPPVGVYFKKENIDTLDATGELLTLPWKYPKKPRKSLLFQWISSLRWRLLHHNYTICERALM